MQRPAQYESADVAKWMKVQALMQRSCSADIDELRKLLWEASTTGYELRSVSVTLNQARIGPI